jgi:two-component system response regulator HydG
MLQGLPIQIHETASEPAAVKWLEQSGTEIVLAGVSPNDPDALELLTYVKRKMPRTPVILLFSEAHAERNREAIVRGASGVLRLPIAANQLRAMVSSALGEPEVRASQRVHSNGHSNGRGVAVDYRHALGAESTGGRSENGNGVPRSQDGGAGSQTFLGDDPSVRQAVETTAMIAPTRTPVLIVGEHGTGKTSLARMLHERSDRHDRPFVEFCCGAMSESQIEVELFGKRSAGFGDSEREGRLSAAEGGTLFIDEVATFSPGLQFKILRLLRDGEYEPVGSAQSLKADVRLVVGSRDDLAPLVQEGRFRQDLYYRIGVVSLKLTPLRHRGGDIDRLAEHFRERFCRQLGKTIQGFSNDALDRLRQHDWPGNVQEMEHVIERAVVHCRGSRIETSHLSFAPREVAMTPAPLMLRSNGRAQRAHAQVSIQPLKEALEGPEKQLILQALEALNWNRQETARVLDINRTTLYKKMKKYGLLFDEPVWMN